MATQLQERIDDNTTPNRCVVLSDDLLIYPKTKPVYRVEVTPSGISYIPNVEGRDNISNATNIDFNDIVGCDCLKGIRGMDTNAYVAIYSYPHCRKIVSKKTVRRRAVVTLTFSKHENYEGNSREAERWRVTLKALLHGSPVTQQDVGRIRLQPAKKLLVLVNPFSGPGKALQIFQERVVPMFAEAGLHFNMVVTEKAGHAREIAKTMKLSEWYAIVIVSGDGLLYEVVNGLMERADWEQARFLPLGVLPGGSGNALCCTLNFHAGEPFTDNLVLHSTYLITKHKVVPMDLVAIDTCKQRIYSFLSVTWGIVADVDIESEKYRSLGNARFTVGAIARILGLRKYRGRLSFLPLEEYHPPQSSSMPKRSRSESVNLQQEATGRPVRCQSMIDVPYLGNRASVPLANGRTTEDVATEHGVSLRSPQELEQVLPWDAEAAPPLENGHGDESMDSNPEVLGDTTEMQQSRGNSDVPVGNTNGHMSDQQSTSTTSTATASTPPGLVPTPLLSPLGEQVPDDWVTIEDDFISMAATCQSHLSADVFAAPKSKLEDGIIYLTFIRAPISRSRILALLLAMDDGSYLKHEGQEIVPVKAFRLEPLESNGILCVDGEIVDYGPIQAQVLPSMARVMTRISDMP